MKLHSILPTLVVVLCLFAIVLEPFGVNPLFQGLPVWQRLLLFIPGLVIFAGSFFVAWRRGPDVVNVLIALLWTLSGAVFTVVLLSLFTLSAAAAAAAASAVFATASELAIGWILGWVMPFSLLGYFLGLAWWLKTWHG